MRRLSPVDYESLLNCLRELHSISDLSTLRLWLLDVALPQLIPSDWFSYNEVDLRSPQNTVSLLRPETNAFAPLITRFAELSHQHPVIVRQINRTDLSVKKISDFMPSGHYHRLDLYNDVYRALTVEFQISAALETKQDCITAIALSRKRQDYTERDRVVLDQLRPHIRVAVQNLAAAAEAETVSGDFRTALSHHDIGTITADRKGHIKHYSGAALTWIGSPANHRLPAKILSWVMNRYRGPADLDVPGPELRLPHPEGNILVRALRSHSHNQVLLTLKLKRTSPQNQAFGRFGLSAREQEVAHWICEGKTNAQIAQILGISARTVHKHVEHIFERLGVESRLAVTIRLME